MLSAFSNTDTPVQVRRALVIFTVYDLMFVCKRHPVCHFIYYIKTIYVTNKRLNESPGL